MNGTRLLRGSIQLSASIHSSVMCIEKILYCIHCKRNFDIPPWDQENGVQIVQDFLCGRRDCLRFQRHFNRQLRINPFYYGFDLACGGFGCSVYSCRTEKIYFDCTQTPRFDMRKYFVAL